MKIGTGVAKILLSIVGDIHSAESPEELHQVVQAGLARAVPGDVYDLVLFGDLRHENNFFYSTPKGFTDGEMQYMLTHVGDHPLGEALLHGEPRTIRIPDVMPARQWWRSEFFNESGYRRLGLRHEIAARLPGVSESGVASFSIARTSRDFSATDCEIIECLRPHLARAWKRMLSSATVLSPEHVRKVFPILSLREAEVLFWLTEGKLNSEIAGILQRRLTTVQEHVENITRKLGTENRHATAMFAIRKLLQG